MYLEADQITVPQPPRGSRGKNGIPDISADPDPNRYDPPVFQPKTLNRINMLS